MSDSDFRPPREKPSALKPIIAIVVLLLAAAAGWWYWQQRAPVPEALPPQAAAPETPPEPAPAPAAPAGPQFPVEPPAAEPAAKLPALADSDGAVGTALEGLVGRKSVLSWLQMDGFVRRAVATVDNLTREQAPSRMWPVQPAPQRFSVSGQQGGAQYIALDNAARYTPFVQFAESVDTAKSVALYRRLYPLFQEAYEELGYPGRYFNDRLVGVIDHLLQTPEPAGPIAVQLTEVKGDVPSVRPWVRYEFADPALQSLSSGQKLLVRMGPVNERRLKAKLRDWRNQLVAGGKIDPAKS
jgi:hypothetical protein